MMKQTCSKPHFQTDNEHDNDEDDEDDDDDDEQGFDDEDEYLDDEDIEVVAYMHIWRICTLGLCLKMVLSVLMTAPDNSYNGHTGQFFSYKWNVRFTEEPTLLGSSSGDCNP